MEAIETSWHSYPSIYQLGHAALDDLFKGDVVIEEKIDGSQFSFGVFPDVGLRVKSKGQEMTVDAPEKMFATAVEAVQFIKAELCPGWTYRAEYLQKPKHNTLAYGRVPNLHLIIFDVNIGHERYLSRTEKEAEAARLGLEVVPCYQLQTQDHESLLSLLKTESILGGTAIEGFVVKNYDQFGRDKKVLMGKFVSEAFKERHGKEWRKTNPTNGDILLQLSDRYRAEGRWAKAAQHLREAGELEESVRDIGKLIKEIPLDVKKECEEEIKELLFKWAWPHIARSSVRGFPEWWKERLLKNQQFQ